MPIDIAPYLGLRTPVSALTHLSGCLLAIAMTVKLLRLVKGNWPARIAFACFGLCATTLYAASAIYHALELPPAQLAFFRLLDHSAIYLLIAGTYTPTVALVIRKPPLRDGLLATIWGLAIAGIAAKWLVSDGPYWLTVAPYLLMGWLGFIAFAEIRRSVGMSGLLWIIYGGIAYSIGAVIDTVLWPTLVPRIFGTHELFHVLVMLGTFCHYVFMERYVVPFATRVGPVVALQPVCATCSYPSPHLQPSRCSGSLSQYSSQSS